MSFWQRIFGKGKTSSVAPHVGSQTGEKMSYFGLLTLVSSGEIKVLPKQCEISGCGKTFLHPSAFSTIMTPDESITDYILDTGGYCRSCRKYVCERHAKFIKEPNTHSFGQWSPACKKCGSPLAPGLLVLKFSTFAEQQKVELSDKQCDICNDIFKLPAKPVIVSIKPDDVKKNGITTASFDHDIGGYCRKCNKNVCRKHVKVVEYSIANIIYYCTGACAQCGRRFDGWDDLVDTLSIKK